MTRCLAVGLISFVLASVETCCAQGANITSAPAGAQSITQPGGTTMTINNLTATNEVATTLTATDSSAVRFGSIRFADQFPGSVGAKIDAACADLSGSPGLVIIPSTMVAGWTSTGIPDGCVIFDLRGSGNSTGTGNFLSGVEYYSRNSASASVATTIRGPLTLQSDDFAGGVNGAGNKTQSQLISGQYFGRDLGEHHGAGNYSVECQGAGDCLSWMAVVHDWGGYNAGGDEGQEFRSWFNVGDGTTTGAVPTSSSITVAGSTISGTWTNAHSLGVRNDPLIITSRGTYSTGSISAATFSGGACHITGTGTSWAGLTNIVAMRINQFEAASAKFVVPVTSINSNTDITLNWQQNELGATCPSTFSGSPGNYTLYQGSAITGLGAPSGTIDPASVTVASGAPFSNGDAVEQPIDYNISEHGLFETFYSPFNAGGLHFGMYVQNIGPGTMESGMRVFGTSGTITNGIRTAGTVSNIVNVGSTGTGAGGGANIIQSSSTAAGVDNLFAFLNGSSQSRILMSYDRPNDWVTIGKAFYSSAADTRISTNSTPQANTEFYMGYGGAGFTGLEIAPTSAPNAGVAQLSVDKNGGTTLFRVEGGSNRVVVNNDTDLKGYSDNESTQTWGVTGSTGAGRFDGGVAVSTGATSLQATTFGSNVSLSGVGVVVPFASNTTSNTMFGASTATTPGSSGGHNTGFGSSVMFHLTTGNYNTGIGDAGLNQLTTGTNNVAAGEQALSSLTTGSNNTALGSIAGVNCTTCDYNIYIGAGAGYNASSSETRHMYVTDGRQNALTDVYWNGNDNNTYGPTAITHHGSGGGGLNANGGDLGLASGAGTGTGTSGAIVMYTAPPGTSGSTQNALVPAFTIQADGSALFKAFTFATLPSAPVNGTYLYCSDCTIANPTASGGTGAFVKRLNGVWVGN